MRSKQPYPTFNRAEEFSLSVGTRTANEVKKTMSISLSSRVTTKTDDGRMRSH